MKIVVSGGIGFIGRALCRALVGSGMNVTVLSRNPLRASAVLDPSINIVEWDTVTSGAWESELDSAMAVINLAGAPIADARRTLARKRLLTESRVLTTRLLVEALSRCSSKPCTLISASGIGYYGASDDRVLDESAARGQGFLADLPLAWEAEALRAAEFGVRVVMLRTGMVLEQDGSALPKMLLPFRLFAGGIWPIILAAEAYCRSPLTPQSNEMKDRLKGQESRGAVDPAPQTAWNRLHQRSVYLNSTVLFAGLCLIWLAQRR